MKTTMTVEQLVNNLKAYPGNSEVYVVIRNGNEGLDDYHNLINTYDGTYESNRVGTNPPFPVLVVR